MLHDAGDERAELVRQGVTDRVWDVERGRPTLDGEREHLVEELRLGAARVLRTEFDIRAELTSKGHHDPRLLEHLLATHPELVFAMDRRSGDEGVDAGIGGFLDPFPRTP